MREYAIVHAQRIFRTVEQIRDLAEGGVDRPKVLELGAMPYVMTVLLRHFVSKDIEVNILPRSDQDSGEKREAYISATTGGQYRFPGTCFNVELDVWPYRDECFGMVVACEILEHLTRDPMWALAEANRVLEPGGVLVISTPNAASFSNALRLMQGGEPCISVEYGPNPYDRHNRELTPSQIDTLMTSAGFEMICINTESYARRPCTAMFSWANRIFFGPAQRRGDFIFAAGRKMDAVRERYPVREKLYRADAERTYRKARP
jgi:SAM-dependent methyltransferase